MTSFFGFVQLLPNNTDQMTVGAQGLSGVLIGNESGYTVVVTMQGNNASRSLYPGTVDWFPIGRGFTGVITFTTSTLLSNVSSWPGSYLQVDLVGSNETMSGQYPFALARIFNVGNSVNTSMGNATNLVNDGNVSGTQIAEAKVGAEAISAVSLSNDGVLTLGNASHVGGVNIQGGGPITSGAITASGEIAGTIAGVLGLSIVGKFSLENGIMTSDGLGSLFFTQGFLFLSQGASAQTIATGGTINLGTASLLRVTSTGGAGITGLIMTPGTSAGQLVFLLNEGSNALTFAAVQTSNVQDGTNRVTQPFALRTLVWNSVKSAWYTA